MIIEHVQTAVLAAGEVNTEGILAFFATKIVPILLAFLGIIFVGRASRGSVGSVLTGSIIAIVGLAFIAGAATLLVAGDAFIKLVFK